MENGLISDGKISASSELDANHPANRGRLYMKVSGSKQACWSARTNNVNQWLQVDLGSQYTRLTGIATQGRNSFEYQCVTKYKVQYSNDGQNFNYYRQPGQTTDKVNIITV